MCGGDLGIRHMRPRGASFSIHKVSEWLGQDQLSSPDMEEAHRHQRHRRTQKRERRKEKASHNSCSSFTPGDAKLEDVKLSLADEEREVNLTALFALVGNLIANHVNDKVDHKHEVQDVASSQCDAGGMKLRPWEREVEYASSRARDISRQLQLERTQVELQLRFTAVVAVTEPESDVPRRSTVLRFLFPEDFLYLTTHIICKQRINRSTPRPLLPSSAPLSTRSN
ncbi:hypothetical protein GUITHDRAFT_114769 [Guillardia theta CCMP2712]|uniref:Uncharacterized protein n=1 Tax=Guillardia theta (strain CCMP2712) TaxID=905079 RepID=L1IS92_GUITC|nr:hypothetical protein GUITHDRAFT_114769 [Guillardia theta CCMP2712]EKX39108.1 hypothetical protein GUITHDRAFT_114769 [Guillardia theta CCMP2712]|eukprot:XP_005826088.1 hypothetical protein GUITHDRAFT_114769 [Guillardia theta CCMP2712]